MLISDWSSDVCSSDLVRKLLDLNRWAVRGQLLLENGNVTNRVIAEHYETSEYNNFYSPFADVNTLNDGTVRNGRSDEHTSELQSLMRISYAVFCLKKTTHTHTNTK